MGPELSAVFTKVSESSTFFKVSLGAFAKRMDTPIRLPARKRNAGDFRKISQQIKKKRQVPLLVKIRRE